MNKILEINPTGGEEKNRKTCSIIKMKKKCSTERNMLEMPGSPFRMGTFVHNPCLHIIWLPAEPY